MSLKNSLAQKKRWLKISKKKRSDKMSKLRRDGWARKTKAERKAEGVRLLKARNKKQKGV